MALIDKETIRAEIERRKIVYRSSENLQDAIRYDEITELLNFIDSLPEQPVTDCHELENEIDACWQNWLSPSNQKEVEGVLPKTEFAMYARHFYELGQQSHPKASSNSFDDEIDRLWESFSEEMSGPHNLFDMYRRLARHFAEWGRKYVLQEIYDGKVKPVDKITAAWLDDEQNILKR